MSYNKVEALREKSDAEKLILSNDYVAARTKLKKAQQLFPALDHIAPMLTVCEILSASTNIIPGYDTDYYWVLQLMPSSTFADITRQYQKLNFLLQPVKYKFPATELALKLLHEAYSILSDKKKRVTFDIKRGTSWVNYESFESNSERNQNLAADCNGEKAHINNMTLQESGSSSSDVISEGYKGQEMDINSESGAQKGVCRTVQQDFYGFDSCRTAECFELRDIWAVHRHLTEPFIGGRYAQILKKSGDEVEVIWLKPIPVTEGERRWFDAGLPIACGSFCLDTETSGPINLKGVFSYKCSWDSGITEELFEIYPKKGEIWAIYQDFDLEEWSYNPDITKGCSFKLVEIISNYSIYTGVECGPLVEVDGFKSVYERQTEGETDTIHIGPRDLYMLAHNVPAYRFTGGEIDGVHDRMFELDQLALRNPERETDNQTMAQQKDPDFLVPTPNPYPNPNPETTVLGSNWCASDFTTGQIWAVYSGKDSMPRQYILVNSVLSISPTRLSATFLEPEPASYHENIWKNRNLPIVCGNFRPKESTMVSLDASQLSHPVTCFKSTTASIYKIFPSKGEIWAVYKNWKSGWGHLNYDNYKCWVVEILSDFSDGEKVLAVRLVEVKGCLTFFQRLQGEDGFEMVRGFSRREMSCFSHRIPAFRVPGISGHGIPESSWHLEPVVLPPNSGK